MKKIFLSFILAFFISVSFQSFLRCSASSIVEKKENYTIAYDARWQNTTFLNNVVSTVDNILKNKDFDFDETYFVFYRSTDYNFYITFFDLDIYDNCEITNDFVKFNAYSLINRSIQIYGQFNGSFPNFYHWGYSPFTSFFPSPTDFSVGDFSAIHDSSILESASRHFYGSFAKDFSYYYFSENSGSDTRSASQLPFPTSSNFDTNSVLVKISYNVPDIPFQDLGFYSKTLGINKAGFFEWLINTSNKDKIFDILPNVAENKLNDIVNYFDLYGGSSWSFFSNLPKLLISLSVSDISVDLLKELYQTLLNLYSEYQEYLNVRPTDIVKVIQSLLPTVDDLTNNPVDADLTVVDSSDDSYIKILKNILNGEIFLMNIINSNTDRIVNSVDKLSFNSTVNVDFDNLTRVGNLSENYYYGEINSNFSEKMSFYQNYELVSNDFENNFFGDFQQSENLVFNFSLPSNYNDGWEYTQYSINVTEHFRTVIVFVRTFISFFTVLFFYQRIKFNLPNLINRKS